MPCGKFEIRIAVDTVVQYQVTCQHFPIHPLSAGARAHDGFGGFDARNMHDVDWHIEHVGNGDGAVGRLALDGRRA